MDRYFAHRFLLWMPKRHWQVILRCPQKECGGRELTSAGIYQRVRQVVDVNCHYYVGTEYLECGQCKKKIIGWSLDIINQLDVSHQLQFPAIFTYRYACDMKVVRLMRSRTLGNSATQVQKTLVEEYGETWLNAVMLYLGDYSNFKRATEQGLVTVGQASSPPAQPIVPQPNWFQRVYLLDVMSRIDEVKASITSTFGEFLKMDSTKKIVRKLAGHGAGTASWMTNVGNEHGQVLISVLTAAEGYGLAKMARGIMDRYKLAKKDPPKILYIDRECCSPATRRLFSDWKDMEIRLDIWHFMRRIASCVTTESHQLYGDFMKRLSGCIFEWSREDLDRLKLAKTQELEARHVGPNVPMDQWLTKRELATYCRRRTRGVEETERLLEELLLRFTGDAGKDIMAVPLLDEERVWEMWESQKPHIPCMQDPPGISLYDRIGWATKGGIQLPIYRCARGSTSLESLHLHLNRWVPGSRARDTFFQAYILDGLVRWNEDRAMATDRTSQRRSVTQSSYSCRCRHAVNELSQEVLGHKLYPAFRDPFHYTGELIGVEYLYSQTGRVLQDDAEDSEEDDTDLLPPEDGQASQQDLEVDDITLAPVSMFTVDQSSQQQPLTQPIDFSESDRPLGVRQTLGSPTDPSPAISEADPPEIPLQQSKYLRIGILFYTFVSVIKTSSIDL